MKKQYINPTMEIIEVVMEQAILTASVGFGDPLSGDYAAAPEFDSELFSDDVQIDFEL